MVLRRQWKLPCRSFLVHLSEEVFTAVHQRQNSYSYFQRIYRHFLNKMCNIDLGAETIKDLEKSRVLAVLFSLHMSDIPVAQLAFD